MLYKYILDDSIKIQLRFWQLITWLDQRKDFLFLPWVNLYKIMGLYLHDPPSFNGPFFMTPPFSAVSKGCDPPSVSTPPSPLLISDKSLNSVNLVLGRKG